jgi:type VI secretion system protein ImpL
MIVQAASTATAAAADASFGARMAPALPWLLGGIVLLLLAIALVIYLVLRGGAGTALEPEPEPEQEEERVVDAGRQPIILLTGPRRSFAAGVAALRRYVPGRDARYRIPWVLMMGAEGSGKTAVADAVNLPRPFPTGEDERGNDGIRWGFFEQGVLLDVPGEWMQRRGGGAGELSEWRTFLRVLQWYRPGRPLDAVVLTLPADELAGPTASGRQALLARAEGLRTALTEAQRRLGVRVPVHVLVTRCDRIPGFTATCREIPEAARDELFGWSSPYPTEATFAPAWVDEAYDALDRSLYETQTELLSSAAPANADGVFRFPAELRRTHEALRLLLGEVFRESAYHEGFFFRGIYFTGDPSVAATPAELAADGAASAHVDAGPDLAPSPIDRDETVDAGGPRRAAPLFLRQLFAERVFAEAGLARPCGSGLMARGRGARAAQIAAAVLVVLGTPALLLANHRLNRTGTRTEAALESARPVLALLDAEVDDTASARAGGQVDVLGVVERMASLPVDRLWSPVVPASWGSGLRDRLRHTQAASFRDAVYPAMRRRLDNRARTLLADGAGDWHATATPGMVADYLRQLGGLSENVNRFNRLATAGQGTPADLEGLAEYLYGVRPAGASASRMHAYQWAVRNAGGRRLAGDRTPEAVDRAEALAGSVYDRLGATLSRLEATATGLAYPPREYDAAGMITGAGYTAPSASPATGPFSFTTQRQPDEFDAFGGATAPSAAPFAPGRLRAYFSGADSAWLAPEAPLPPAVAAALARIPTSDVLSAARFRREFSEGFNRQRAARLSGMDAEGGAFPEPGAGGARSLVALRDALGALQTQEFAGGGAPVRLGTLVPPGTPLAWDTVALGAALSRYESYRAFVSAPSVAALPARGRNLVRNLAAAQLESGMTYDVARAARAGGGGAYLAGNAERGLRARVAGMQTAAAQLSRVLDAYQQLGLAPSYDDLAGTVAAQGAAVLRGADALLDAQGLYLPRDGGFDWWNGETPVAFGAFGVRDTAGVDVYLASQLDAVRQIHAAYVEPVLALLDSDAMAAWNAAPPADADAALAAAARWKSMADQLAAYTAKRPNSLSALETLIGQGMLAVAPGNCAPAGRGARGGDWFAQRYERIRSELYARCRHLSARAVAAGYRDLRDAFQGTLAGRFPFAPADARVEADAAAVAEFLALYAAREPARRSVTSGSDGVGGPGSAAAAFLGRMDAAAAFLAPFVAADTAGGPAYHVAADFRVAHDREAGADQVAGWQLRVGDETLTPRDSAGAALPWSPGTPVWALFRWADGSLVRPTAAGLPWPARVDGAQLGYGYGGTWGLLRMLRARGTTGPAHTLSFPATVVPAPIHAPRATPGAGPESALLFVRVRVMDPATGRERVLPAFPTEAPALHAGERP